MWSHEQQHLNAGMASASQNDLHAMVEPLLSSSQSQLETAVSNTIGSVKGTIRTKMLATHTGTNSSFVFYYPAGQGLWTLSSVTVFN